MATGGKTTVDGDQEFRRRLYRHYLSARDATPHTLAQLAPRAATLRRLIRDHFPADREAPILDLGCGHGALIHFAREAGYRNIGGVEGSPQQVTAARELGIDGVLEGEVMEHLEGVKAASLEAVISFDLLEHLSKAELPALTDQIHRVLRPGGRWIIHAPNAASPLFGRVRYGDLTHELAFTAESLRHWLAASGFASVTCREDGPVPHGPKSALRWLLWRGLRLGLRLYLAVESGDGGREAIFTQNLLAVARK